MASIKEDDKTKTKTKTKTEGKDGDEEEVLPFTHYYGMLTHQQNMLQDLVRTGTYREAVMQNAEQFKDKVVIDVGAGTGILSLFAAQAGARKVYAVEASSMARKARSLVKKNSFDHIIEVVEGKIEDIDIPEKADIIISEPMGFLLLHERMLEVFCLARERWGKPDTKMFPTTGTIYLSLFSDAALLKERESCGTFWKQSCYGIDLSCLEKPATEQVFAQPIVGYFDPSILVVDKPVTKTFDFSKCSREELQKVKIPFSFAVAKTSIIHGMACWFDVKFCGDQKTVCLSTGPHTAGTHWYQCRLLFREPIAANRTQIITGTMTMDANEYSSFVVTVQCKLGETTFSARCDIQLQDQYYEYLS
eukprot:g5469.t1